MAKPKTPGTAGPGNLKQAVEPAWFMPDQLERRPISELVPYARNARTHSDAQIAQLRASIREFGFINPVLIDSAGNIIAGHGRVLAAQAEGMTEVPCVLVEHLSDAQRRAYILADNRLAEMSGWDLDMVAIELGDIRDAGLDLTITGFTEADLELEPPADEGAPNGNTFEDEPPEQVEPRTSSGQVWRLGEHRLMCGDCTLTDDMRQLMGDEKANLVFTDPPYGVGVSGNGSALSTNHIQGDLTQTLIPFAFEMAIQFSVEKARLYFCGGNSNWEMYNRLFMRYTQHLVTPLIWVKNGFVIRQNGYHSGYEVIYFGFKPGGGGSDFWFGGRSEEEANDVWNIARDPTGEYKHPTQKPVEIPARAIRNSCEPHGLVLDLFGGSGSTLIACEQLGRRCYMMEMEPKYCDVIIARWEKLTGRKAELIEEV